MFLFFVKIYPLGCIITLRKKSEESVDELFQDPATLNRAISKLTKRSQLFELPFISPFVLLLYLCSPRNIAIKVICFMINVTVLD